MLNIETFSQDDFDRHCSLLVHTHPLVHCMTNDVVQEITADVLLAAGASPAMIIDEHESADFAAIADCLLVNVGTLTDNRYKAMLLAVESCSKHSTPWVLDPVAAGLLPWRDERVSERARKKPTVIRGNASEIICLAGLGSGGHGVDSVNGSDEALQAAQNLALRTGAVVAVSGAADFITNGERTLKVTGGHIMATRVVGTGCSLGALVAAFITLDDDILNACSAAHALFKVAEELAIKRAQGPGTFHSAFLDALYNISHAD